jgi:hypothetical protein
MARKWSWLLTAALIAAATQAQAQAQEDDGFSLDDPEASPPPAPPPPPPEEAPALLGDEQALQEEAAPQEQFRQSTDPYEDPKKSYFFVGAGWRFVRLPAWTLEMFLESAPAVGSAGSGIVEFGYRKDGFQVTAGLGITNWDFTGPFQLSGDPPQDTEWLDADWLLMDVSAAVTWSTSFTDWLALEYGLQAGAAFIFGDMTRTEAYRTNGGWAACPRAYIGPPSSDPYGGYCDQPIPEDLNGDGMVADSEVPAFTNSADEIGAHYGVKAAKGLKNKGIPRAVPLIGPRVSLRFKPIAQLVLRVDVPLPVFPLGFMGGISAQYGF